MKYMQDGGFARRPLMRLTLLLTLALLACFLVTNFAMFYSRLGLTPVSVAAYYLGSEADFTRPRTFGSMLEAAHAHLPMMALVLLLLTHLLLFAPHRDRLKSACIWAVFLAALVFEGAGWLVRYAHPGFAWLKLAAFCALQGLLALLIIGLGAFLLRERLRRTSRSRGHWDPSADRKRRGKPPGSR